MEKNKVLKEKETGNKNGSSTHKHMLTLTNNKVNKN